jgi:hypothetical protein
VPELPDEKKRTMLLGLAFLILLAISSVENAIFFNVLGDIFPPLEVLTVDMVFIQVGTLFIHNVLVVSLILLGMTFYVNLVISGFFKREKYSHVVLDHPRTFALVFTIMVVFLSILRGSSLLGGINVELLPLVLLVSAPIGIVEGYGIYLTIARTLSRSMSMRGLAYIYGIFFIAAVMEVGFINLLIWVTAG